MAAKKREKAPNYPQAKMREALSAWIETGCSRRAAKQTGVKDATIRTWKRTQRALYDEVVAVHADEVKRAHRAHVRRAWSDASEAARIAGEKIKGGEYGDAKEFRLLAQTVLDFARCADHAMRLDAGDPTSITEERRTDAEVLKSVERMAAEMGVTVELPQLDPQISHTLEDRH